MNDGMSIDLFCCYAAVETWLRLKERAIGYAIGLCPNSQLLAILSAVCLADIACVCRIAVFTASAFKIVRGTDAVHASLVSAHFIAHPYLEINRLGIGKYILMMA